MAGRFFRCRSARSLRRAISGTWFGKPKGDPPGIKVFLRRSTLALPKTA